MLTAADIDTIRADFDDIGPDIETGITYRRYTGITPGDTVLGTPDKATYTDLPINVSIRELTLEEISVSGGAYVLGDIECKIRQTVLENQPDYNDRIVYAGASFRPKSISPVSLGGVLYWKVRAGRE